MTMTSLACVAAVCLVGAAPVFADAQADARLAVENWLAAHDRGNYAETWETSADYTKGLVPKEKWPKLMQSALAPFGKLESRSLHSAAPVKELPGMPDGEYVVFQFKAQYENKKSAIETIIPMVEDGQWRVMTYRIR